jgi:serine protease Do
VAERPDEAGLARGGRGGQGEDEAPELRGKAVPHGVGLQLADLNPVIARQLDLRNAPKKGVVVVGVAEGSLAEQSGLGVGDIILDINRQPVKTAAEAVKAFKKGANNLRVLRDGNTLIVFMDAK